MTLRTLIRRSLRFHWRGHLGVLLGAAVGSAALIGALVVGDSVRGTLRESALQRLGWVDAAMAPHDRFFTQDLADRVNPPLADNHGRKVVEHTVTLLRLPGTAARQDGTARANQVNVLGVTDAFWQAGPPASTSTRIPQGGVLLNEALAAQLNAKPGDALVLRVHKPTALSRDVPITPQNDASIALRLKVHGIVPGAQLGNFSLQANQAPPLNAFLAREELAAAAGLAGKANVIVAGGLSSLPENWRSFLSTNATTKPPGAQSAQVSWYLDSGLWLAVGAPDLSLEVRLLPDQRFVEVRSERIFIDPAVVAEFVEPPIRQVPRHARPILLSGIILRPGMTVDAVHPAKYPAHPILTYLVNQLRAGTNTTPYSMVTAAGPPWTPADLRDDEIVVNQWLADDLKLKPGDPLDLTYFLAESGARLVERTNRFRVRSIVPLSGLHADRTLMPEFPGLAKAESTHEWDAGFPLVHKIRDEDEQYWKDHRGTPKAFVTLAAGQAMWGNRFGNLTAIRYPVVTNDVKLAANSVNPTDQFRTNLEGAILLELTPAALGLSFEPVRAQALAAASQAQDFGGLFLGFSFFLILAALILMALLFQFGLEQRVGEIGTLLAVGFTPRQVRGLLLREGVAVAFVGGLLGVLGGLGYARGMLHLLATLWRDAVGGNALGFHVTGPTLGIGLGASVIVCAVTIGVVLRKQAKRPARALLAEGGGASSPSPLNGERAGVRGETVHRDPASQKRRPARWIAITCALAALALIGWALSSNDGASPPIFFGAGSLLLIAGLAGVAELLTALERREAGRRLTLAGLGLRGCTRRRQRSLACAALLACGSFLIVAVGANRLDAGRDATRRGSGTGGFALWGEATLPIVRDLNTAPGREFYGLDDKALAGVSVVPFRVRDGDEASCLNLNRAQKPRLLGVKPELLAERGAFTFARVESGRNPADGWKLLLPDTGKTPPDPDEIPAIGDAASIQWALGKKIGETLDYTDERGRTFRVRLVAGVANSLLQGNLIIDEAAFLRRFPGEAGHRMFLIDAPSNPGAAASASAELSRALQDTGLELTPTTRRLAAFNAVQNTYLNTFQVLGGLGLLLGSAGLGVVVLRNVLERRGELGLLQAVGFRRRSLRWLILSEHGGLLALGLAVGVLAALAAVAPVLFAPGASVHATALGLTLAGVLVSGLLWTWLATRAAMRGELLKALRNE